MTAGDRIAIPIGISALDDKLSSRRIHEGAGRRPNRVAESPVLSQFRAMCNGGKAHIHFAAN
jgi:hypothetical protein